MVQRKIVVFDKVQAGQRTLRFHCNKPGFSFLRNSTYISIYCNEEVVPRFEFFAERYLRAEAPQDTSSFDKVIPGDVNSVKVILETARPDYDISQLNVSLVN